MLKQIAAGLFLTFSYFAFLALTEPRKSSAGTSAGPIRTKSPGVYGASYVYLLDESVRVSISVGSIKKSYSKVGPFTFSLAPFVDVGGLEIDAPLYQGDHNQLLGMCVSKITDHVEDIPVLIRDLKLTTQTQTNLYENFRL